MSTLGLKLRSFRKKSGFSLRKAAVAVDIDVAILSKMERGERRFSKEIILKLAGLYDEDADTLMIDFLSEKVIYELKNEKLGLKALKAAEEYLLYNNTRHEDQ